MPESDTLQHETMVILHPKHQGIKDRDRESVCYERLPIYFFSKTSKPYSQGMTDSRYPRYYDPHPEPRLKDHSEPHERVTTLTELAVLPCRHQVEHTHQTPILEWEEGMLPF